MTIGGTKKQQQVEENLANDQKKSWLSTPGKKLFNKIATVY